MTRSLLFGLVFSFSFLSVYSQAPSISVHTDLATSATPVQVLYVSGQYIAVFNPLQLYSSTDAIHWTGIAAPAVSLNGKLAFGAGRYVCITDGGKIYSSTDLVSWTVYNSPLGASGFQTDVEFLNGAFYITGYVGNSSTLLHSADGLSWDVVTVSSDPGLHDYYQIAYGNGLYVINDYAQSGQSNIYTSPTGISGSWTLSATITTGSAANMKYLGQHFYLFAMSNGAFVSDDAVTWNPVTYIGGTPPVSPSGGFQGVGVLGPPAVYTLVGYGTTDDPAHVRGSLYTSSDGLTFYQGPILIPFPAYDGTIVNNQVFAFGFSQLEVSGDGILFQSLGLSYAGLAFNGSQFVADANQGLPGEVDYHGFFYHSTDFKTWTAGTSGTDKFGNPTTITATSNTILWDSSRFLVFADLAVYSSADGLDWQILGQTQKIKMAAYGGGTYVSSGDSLSYSHDAVSWTRIPVTGDIHKIRYINGAFYAAGEDDLDETPFLLRSTNGADWSSVPITLSSPNGSFEDILYDGANYCLTGSGRLPDGSIRSFFSVVFDNIDNPNSGTFTEGGISGVPGGVRLGSYGDETYIYNNGHFVGGAVDVNHNGDGYLVYSSDGVDWKYSRLNAYTAINAIVASADTFRMTGTNDVLLTASFAGGTLPVTLLDFEAVAQGSTGLLTWKTAEETNSSRFVVQRSVDGVRWDSIGVVAAAGNSAVTRDYRFVDANPVAGYDDYRLALVDRDGARQLSIVKRVFFGGTGVARVYPNPAGDVVNVELPGLEGTTVATLYDATGALVYRQEFGGYTTTLQVRPLPAGIYQLVIEGPNGWQLRRAVLHH